jgi:hypothetical protein
LTTLAAERAHAGRDDGGPIAALAAVARGDPRSLQDSAADATANAEKPPEAGGDGGVWSKGRLFTPDGKLVYVNVSSTADHRTSSRCADRVGCSACFGPFTQTP